MIARTAQGSADAKAMMRRARTWSGLFLGKPDLVFEIKEVDVLNPVQLPVVVL